MIIFQITDKYILSLICFAKMDFSVHYWSENLQIIDNRYYCV